MFMIVLLQVLLQSVGTHSAFVGVRRRALQLQSLVMLLSLVPGSR
jgi:hypothetical protein